MLRDFLLWLFQPTDFTNLCKVALYIFVVVFCSNHFRHYWFQLKWYFRDKSKDATVLGPGYAAPYNYTGKFYIVKRVDDGIVFYNYMSNIWIVEREEESITLYSFLAAMSIVRAHNLEEEKFDIVPSWTIK